MNYGEMQRELKAIIQDASPEILVSIPDYINEAVQQIAEDIKFPELKQVTTVTTSTSTYYVNFPVGFSSRLLYAGDSTDKYTVLDGGIEELISIYPSLAESGDIKHLAQDGNILYYQPIPTTATVITCIGYFVPATLTNDTDTPDFIPSYLRRESIVNKAAAIAYNIMEDDINEGKVNTRVFTNLAIGGLNKIREYVSRRRPVISSSCWSF